MTQWSQWSQWAVACCCQNASRFIQVPYICCMTSHDFCSFGVWNLASSLIRTSPKSSGCPPRELREALTLPVLAADRCSTSSKPRSWNHSLCPVCPWQNGVKICNNNYPWSKHQTSINHSIIYTISILYWSILIYMDLLKYQPNWIQLGYLMFDFEVERDWVWLSKWPVRPATTLQLLACHDIFVMAVWPTTGHAICFPKVPHRWKEQNRVSHLSATPRETSYCRRCWRHVKYLHHHTVSQFSHLSKNPRITAGIIRISPHRCPGGRWIRCRYGSWWRRICRSVDLSWICWLGPLQVGQDAKTGEDHGNPKINMATLRLCDGDRTCCAIDVQMFKSLNFFNCINMS